ncbi:MAG: hypothetical protein R3330_06570, partial [Saprospiraceae bacterium]|nr:hypothetical protein [Saprospiraceae bacterium]
ATCANLVDMPVADLGELDSRDFMSDFSETESITPPRNTLIIEGQPGIAIREGNWVLIPHQGSGGFTTEIPNAPYLKLPDLQYQHSDYLPDGTLKPDAPEGQLYHLGNDPGQQHNVYGEHPDIAAHLFKLMLASQGNVDLTRRRARMRRDIEAMFVTND